MGPGEDVAKFLVAAYGKPSVNQRAGYRNSIAVSGKREFYIEVAAFHPEGEMLFCYPM